jgi:hypothetical protein
MTATIFLGAIKARSLAKKENPIDPADPDSNAMGCESTTTGV